MKGKYFEAIVRTKAGFQHYVSLYGCANDKQALVSLLRIVKKQNIDGLFLHAYNENLHKYEIETKN